MEQGEKYACAEMMVDEIKSAGGIMPKVSQTLAMKPDVVKERREKTFFFSQNGKVTVTCLKQRQQTAGYSWRAGCFRMTLCGPPWSPPRPRTLPKAWRPWRNTWPLGTTETEVLDDESLRVVTSRCELERVVVFSSEQAEKLKQAIKNEERTNDGNEMALVLRLFMPFSLFFSPPPWLN